MRAYDLPEIEIVAVCHDCRRQHVYRELPHRLSAATGEWITKHDGHRINFHPPRAIYGKRLLRWIRDFWCACPLWAPADYQYGHNADVKVAYATTAVYTWGLASLATSSTRTAGRESTAISNTTNKYLDYLVAFKFTTGTTPTVNKQFDAWAYFSLNDTPDYPDVIDGTDSAETITSENVRNSALTPLRSILVDSTSDRTYFSSVLSLAALHPSLGPMTHHGLFGAHDTVAALNATAGNQAGWATPIYGTVI